MRKFAFALATLAISAAAQTVSSPDGTLVVDVNCDGGKPVYTVDYNGVRFLEPSPLGLVANVGDYTQGLELIKVSDTEAIADDYSLPNIKNSDAKYRANTRKYTFGRNGKKLFDVIFNVSDNDVAYKYKLHGLKNGESVVTCAVVESEASGFALPEGTTTFLCPQAIPMTGWERTYPSYETNYVLDAPMGTNGVGDGFTFPCLFKNGDKGWLLISETGVDGNYVASHLDCRGGNLYSIDFPNQAEMNGAGMRGAAINLPGETPWRTITLGTTLAPIMETTIPFDVVKPKFEASKPYEYGKGTWSWIIKMDPSCNFDEQIRYIDFAADLGWQTVLVDALWDTQIGYDKMEELARYAKSKGIELYLWYNSNGNWNDAPQGPRNKMDRSRVRRAEMKWLKDNGVRGIKVDFFGGDKQQMMQLYEDILSDANDYGIEVIFHGCTIPRGWERMYPNFIACEAVLASENLHFDQKMCDIEAFNATIHPLVRNTIGSMDFGGSALNKFYNADNITDKGTKRMTSDVFAIANATMYQSPVQHFALAPNNLADAPAWAIDFMKTVPTTWDETRFIDGYPGKYLIMARRHGDTWYVSAINAEKETLKKKVKLPMFAPGTQVTVYSDNEMLEGSLKTQKTNKKQEFDIVVPNNGAMLIINQ